MDQEEDTFTSVTWADNGNHHPNGQGSALIQSSSNPTSPSRQQQPLTHARNASTDAHRQIGGLQTGLGAIGRSESARALSRAANDVEPPKWEGYLMVQVTDPRKELENTKEMFISYGIRAETNLAHFNKTRLTTRRRFQDFVFLREHLSRDFPACVVPPLPDKHRLEYLRGDRFGQEFLEKRSADLQLFLERVCRHPTLQRAQLLRSFLESTEWQVDMHAHNSSPTSAIDGSGNSSSILDSLSDTLLNAFTKVRKPDERFQEMREALDRFEEGLASTERVVVRNKSRTTATPLAGDLYTPGLGVDPEDLSTDYEDFASSIEGLGYLESGITKPLNQVASTMLEFAKLQRQASTRSTEAMLSHVSALISYAQAHKSTLKLRDQKQLDFEELTDYLSSVVNERDRLASLSSPYGAGHGHGGVRGAGITGYIKDRVDGWRGVDEERTRVERMQRLDGRIKELQDAVTSAHDTSLAFSNEVLREHTVFEMAKEAEMKELLTTYADGQIEMYRKAMESFDRLIPQLEQIKTDP